MLGQAAHVASGARLDLPRSSAFRCQARCLPVGCLDRYRSSLYLYVWAVLQCFCLEVFFIELDFVCGWPCCDAMPKPSSTPSSASKPAPSSTRKPVPLTSRLWSCSELRAGQLDLKGTKLEPAANDDRLAGLRRSLEASLTYTIIIACATDLRQYTA